MLTVTMNLKIANGLRGRNKGTIKELDGLKENLTHSAEHLERL